MNGHVLTAILLLFGVGLVMRTAPFVFAEKLKKSRLVAYLAAMLPACLMVLLSLYGLEGKPAYGLVEMGCLVGVVALHLWRRNVLLSTFGGTSMYLIIRSLI